MAPNILLKMERDKRGWTQKEVADQIKAGEASYHRWESQGASPMPYYRQELARLFGKTIEELGLLPSQNSRPSAINDLAQKSEMQSGIASTPMSGSSSVIDRNAHNDVPSHHNSQTTITESDTIIIQTAQVQPFLQERARGLTTEEIQEQERTPNPLLRRQRELRRWSQGQVTKELQALFPGITVTAKDVGRWESGERWPSPYYREKLCVLFQTTADKLGFVPQDVSFEQNGEEDETAQGGEFSSLWTVPFRRNPFFTGRDQFIQTMRERFVSSGTSSFSQIQALCGLGGIGKTQIAIEYAHRYRDAYQFVLWVKATRSTLLADFVTLADLLNLPEKEQKDQSILIASIKRWFVSHESWLLIFDNVDDIEPVYDLLPVELTGHVLLTTHIYALGTFAYRVDVDKMNAEEGALLLLRRAKMADVSFYEPVNNEEMTNAKVLVDLLDGLPLALDQAGAYIEETACTISHYVSVYRSRQSFLLG